MLSRRAIRGVFTYPCPRKMREIVKMSLIEHELPGKIKEIWNNYHAPRPQNVSTVLTAHQYNLLNARLRASPFFVFPVRREGGHFLLVMQSQEKSQLFTFLDDYKKNPDRATPYLILTMFDEILVKKGNPYIGIVPMRGDVVDLLISKKEAEKLLLGFLSHYIELGLYESTVQVFNHSPDKFQHGKFVEEYLQRFG